MQSLSTTCGKQARIIITPHRIRNIFLKGIDVTMDYSGSFDKDEVIYHLTTKKGFRMQGCTTDADRTILDNTDQVGNNCLTYMEAVQGRDNPL